MASITKSQQIQRKPPILEKVTFTEKQSFALKEELLPSIKLGWHYHPEYEIVLFTEGTGKRFIGDHSDHLAPGDMLLIGSNLPHYMRNDEDYYQPQSTKSIRAIVIHFTEEFCGKGFFDMPEMGLIKKMLQRSGLGIQFLGQTQLRLAKKMELLLKTTGYERLMLLIDILQNMAAASEYQTLSSVGFTKLSPSEDTARIDKAFEYILKNYTENISLSDIAEQCNLSISAFCKFYKKSTGKTFTQTLNEIRVGHACKLFIERGLSVGEVCYQSGFSNLSYFHRNFRKITNYAPLEYRRRFFE
jgi:AraC-like DNA-binding protein/mannose-6-phosphate isomerase-like protein (cupin superfamily)